MSLQSESHIFQGRGMGSWGRRSGQKVLGPAAVAGLVAPQGGPCVTALYHTISPWLGSLRVARGQLT